MFKLIKSQLEIFASLQTLFPSLKIDIFCRIVPLSFIEKLIKIKLEIFGPLQTLFPSLKIAIFCRIVPRWNSWKFRHSKFFVPLQTLFLSLKIAIFSRIAPRSKSKNRQTLANFTSIKQWFSTRSPPGILCVDKITMNKLPAQRENFLRWIPFSNRIS